MFNSLALRKDLRELLVKHKISSLCDEHEDALALAVISMLEDKIKISVWKNHKI